MIHDQRGAIESPNYPNAYPHNAECEWKISPPLGNRVFMEFSNLDLEASSADKCPFDKVIVEERDSSDIVIRSDTFCNELPKPINTTNAVVIKYIRTSHLLNIFDKKNSLITFSFDEFRTDSSRISVMQRPVSTWNTKLWAAAALCASQPATSQVQITRVHIRTIYTVFGLSRWSTAN